MSVEQTSSWADEKTNQVFQKELSTSEADRRESNTTVDSNEESYQTRELNTSSISESGSIDLQASIQPSSPLRAASKRSASITLFKGYIGSGILALPYAFQQGGYLLGAGVFMMISVIVFHTMELLFEVAEKVGKQEITYEELAKQTFGEKGKLVVKIFLSIFQIGCCVSYIIFFLKFFQHVFDGSQESNSNIWHQLGYLSIALCIVLPMNLINRMREFSSVSLIANFLILSTIVAIIVNNFQLILSQNTKQQNKEYEADFMDWKNITMVIGVSIYSFESIGIVFSVRGSVKDSSTFRGVFKNVSLTITILYVAFSILGATAQGKQIQEIILFSLPSRWDVSCFQISYAIALAMSYPLQLLPCVQIIEGNERIKNILRPNTPRFKIRRFIFRSCITFIIFGFAILIPRFALFLNILGAFAGSTLQFIIPVLMHNATFGKTTSQKQLILNYCYLFIGSLGGIVTTVMSIIDLADD